MRCVPARAPVPGQEVGRWRSDLSGTDLEVQRLMSRVDGKSGCNIPAVGIPAGSFLPSTVTFRQPRPGSCLPSGINEAGRLVGVLESLVRSANPVPDRVTIVGEDHPRRTERGGSGSPRRRGP